MNIKEITGKLLSLVRAHPSVGGFEISDSVFRFARFQNGKWQAVSLRLPPGIVTGGRVRDYAQFVEALKTFREQIVGPKSGEAVNVVVSLSSINVYTQVFSLPMIDGENLEKAIELNIQMVSPGETAETYSGWQMVHEDQKSVRLEVLSAFINKAVVDEIHKGLRDAGFVVHSVESRALSLARLVREQAAGFDPAGSYVLLGVDSSGIEVLVLRRSHLYFQYFTSWQDIQGDDRQIGAEKLEMILTHNFQQVMNFYNSHWTEPLAGVFIAAGGLQELVAQVIAKNFSLPIKELALRIQGDLSSDWFVALGSSLRGLMPSAQDRDISLLGITAQEEYRRHQVVSFMEFWRITFPVSLSILLATFLLADMLAVRVVSRLETQSRSADSTQTKEMTDLQAHAKAFNQTVDMITRVVANNPHKFGIASAVNAKLVAEGGVINHLILQGLAAPVSLSGEARSEEGLAATKKALDQDPLFQGVNLPLTEVKRLDGGRLAFSMTFSIVPENIR